MPFVSKAQARLFYAKANANPKKERRYGERGPSKEVAQKFVAEVKGQPINDLPERVKK